MNELEQLRNDNEVLLQRNTELGNRLKIVEKENITIKNTIKSMMDNERSHMAYKALKRLYELIQ